MSYDPAVLLPCIYSNELNAGTQIDTCIPMFIAVLFTIVKREKWPKSVSTEEWVTKCCYSALKRNEILNTSYNMDEPWKHYAKWNKPDVKEQILCGTTYMRYLEHANS